jgi:hypothetical protein
LYTLQCSYDFLIVACTTQGQKLQIVFIYFCFSKLPGWIRSVVPKIFYVTEKAWNFYPLTLTEYTCSFVPRLSIEIITRYEDNNGSSENALSLSPEELQNREVDYVDIAHDAFPEKHYVKEEDCRYFKSKKTGRGPLHPNWRVCIDIVVWL